MSTAQTAKRRSHDEGGGGGGGGGDRAPSGKSCVRFNTAGEEEI